MQFRANPVLVSAFVISEVSEVRADGSMRLVLEDGAVKRANAGMLARYTPVVGDYFVIQEDAYEYVNPKGVFERKYSPSPDTGTELPLADRLSLTIDASGNPVGTPAAIQAFEEFRRARPGLLDVKKPFCCDGCGNPVVGGGCICPGRHARAPKVENQFV